MEKQTSQQAEQKKTQQKQKAEKEFNDAVAKFKEEHPDLFEEKNKAWLDQVQFYLNSHQASGKSVEEALKLSYKDLTEKTKYEAPASSDSSTEENNEENNTSGASATGTLSSTTKVGGGDVETKGAKTEREAAESALESLKSEGLSFPSTT